MIVKNEEEWIAQAIESVQPIIHEAIIVDTGSTDRTKEIATNLGAKVFDYEWKDDFAAARNFSISRATGDWILVLDADEAIASRDLSMLKHLTVDPSMCFEFFQRHYSNDHRISMFKPATGEYPEWERNFQGYFESNLVRLFPNTPGLFFKGKVHELVEHSIRDLARHKVVLARIPIHHFGHTEEVLSKKDKAKLYSPIGMNKISDAPDDWKAHFEMGVEHNRSGRLQESVDALQRASHLNPGYVSTWTNLGYVLCEMTRYREAEKALLVAIQLDPKCHDALCNLGVVYLRTQKLVQAEQCFSKAIELNPKYINAFCNLGKTLVYQKRLSEAVNIYSRALKLIPRCAAAKGDLGVIYLSTNHLDQAEKYLAEAIDDDPKLALSYYHLGQVYKSTGRTTEAVQALEKFCELESQSQVGEPTVDFVKMMTEVRDECESLKERIQKS